MSYFKDYPYYDELYDKSTIRRCKQITKDVREEEKIKNKGNKRKVTSNVDELLISKEKVKSAFKKEETIKEWINRDKEIDKFIHSIKVPKVNCKKCSKLMSLDNTIFNDGFGEEKDRVLFVYTCDSCSKRRAFYDNGEEKITKKELCPKCNVELDKKTKIEKNIYITTYSCNICDFTKEDEFDLGIDNDEENFDNDRKKYCISLEEANSINEWWNNLYNEVKLIFTGKDRKTLARLEKERKYKPLEKIKRMNFKELEIYLDKILNKNGYTDFTLSRPEVGEDIKVCFSVFNSTGESSSMKSNKILRKILKDSLIGINWQLIDQGRFENRLGVIKGKLKGIDDDDKLLKLVTK